MTDVQETVETSCSSDMKDSKEEQTFQALDFGESAKDYVETVLASQAAPILEKQASKPGLAPFWKQKIQKEAAKNWEKFYKRNSTNFFKDRFWTWREFPELLQKDPPVTLLEVGCGVGNFFFPLVQENPTMKVYACDFSPHAISLIHSSPQYDTSRIYAFAADLTKDNLHENVPELVDIVSCLFVMSAIPPPGMEKAVETMASILKPGGSIIFRDYGIFDGAQLRFKSASKLEDKMYCRQDWTLTYFFSIQEVEDLFCKSGYFELVDIDYMLRKLTNAKLELELSRNFVQGRFRRTEKPLSVK